MPPSSEDDEDSEARRLAVAALSAGDAAEALRLCRYPTAGNGRAKPWVSWLFQLRFLPLQTSPLPCETSLSLCFSLSLCPAALTQKTSTPRIHDRPPKKQHWLVAARAHYALGDLRASSQALAEAAKAAAAAAGTDGGGCGGGAGTTPLPSSVSASLVRSNVAAVSLREGKPRCALLCCSLALSLPPSSLSQEQQQQQSSSSSSALPAAIRAAATYNAALASLAIEGEEEGKERRAAAEELEALARSLDDDIDSVEGGKTAASDAAASAAAARPFVLGRRARARVWLRAAESLARVAAAARGKEGGEGEDEEEDGERLWWGRASAAASRAAALAAHAHAPGDDPSSDDGGDPRCRSAALALVAAAETRLGRAPRAREAIRQALDFDPDLGGGGGVEKGSRKKDPLLPGARAVLESYLRAIGS